MHESGAADHSSGFNRRTILGAKYKVIIPWQVRRYVVNFCELGTHDIASPTIVVLPSSIFKEKVQDSMNS